MASFSPGQTERKDELLHPAANGEFIAHLRSPPVDGKANAELIALVARHFGCHRAAVSIRSGAGSRTKRVVIADR
jgi:uncharacterized protein YggU (UPF0235/DUF167 family)